ncbi:MAG: FG-GAP-like repeat-containing protein [Balneolaceae bacterium]
MKKLSISFSILFFLTVLSTAAKAQIPTDSLQLHLKADAGVILTGTEVTSWTDQSGNANNATQTSSTNRPVLVDNSMNGEPVIRFNGTNSFLQLPAATNLGIQSNDYELFIVARSATANTNVEFLLAGSIEQYELHTNGSGGIRYIPKTLVYIDEGSVGDYTDTEPHLYNLRATDTYGSVTVDVDNSTQSNTNSRSSDGGNLYLGARANGSLVLNGDIAEVLLYNAVLSESGRDSVESYLKGKYNIDPPVVAPTTQATNLSTSNVTATSMTINLSSGNGENRVIIAKSGTAVDAIPVDSVTYTANSVFGSGTEIESGNYVVYNGTGSSATVTGLSENTSYHFTAFEYNGDTGEENYLTMNAPTVADTTLFTPISVQSQETVETTASSATFTAIVHSSPSLSTSYRVLWGTEASSLSDSSTTIVKGAGASTDTVFYEITGLSTNTLYYARIRATTSQESILSDPIQFFFNNTTIPNDSLSLWLAADRGLGDIQHGGSVDFWQDLSGASNNASQSSTSNRPTLDTSAVNNLPALYFNGSSTLEISSSLGIENSDFEIFVVAKSSNSNSGYILTKQVSGSYYPSLSYNYNDDGFKFVGSFNSSNPELGFGSNNEYNDGVPHLFNTSATSNSGLLKINAETVVESAGLDFTHSGSGILYIGSAGNNHSFLSGYISEIILYRRTLSGLEKHQVHRYLSDKYNLELPLETPTQQVSNLEFEKTGVTSATLNFSPGNGVNNMAIVKSGSEVNEIPVDSTTYSTSTVFGSGSEIGTGNFVVSAGSDTSVTITGLTPGTTYYASLFSFNGDSGFEKYLTTNPDTASLFLSQSVFISQISPSPFSFGNEANTSIEVTFNEAITTSSFGTDSSFIVNGSESGLHSGTFQFSGGNTVVTFTSDSLFKAGESVTVGITNKLQGATKTFEDPRTYSFNIKTKFSSGTFEKSASLDQSFTSSKTMVSDMNNDGLNDIIMLNRGNYSISVRLADSDSTFLEPDDFTAGDSPTSFAIADIDGDGDEDILVTDDDSSVLKVMYNDGDGEFENSTSYSLNDYSYSVTSGDLDHDGDLDVVVGLNGNISVLINDGTGTLSSPIDYSTNESEEVTEVKAVDIDGDGDTDILASDEYESFYMLKSNGDGTFKSPQVLDTFDYPFDLVYGDIDGDGDVDAVLSSDDDSYLYVYKNNGNGTFASRVAYETDDYGQFLSLNDIDGDGDLDILAGEEDDNYMHIYLNPGAGTFTSYTTFQLDYYIDSFTISDLDMDGDLDLIISTYDSLFLYKNINFDPLTLSGVEGWRLMASPAGKVQYSTILSDLWTQGVSGGDTESGVSNLYYWPATSTSISDTNWTSITNMSDSLKSGLGLLMYVFSDDNGPVTGDAGFPKEIIFPGSIPQTGQNLSSLLNQNTNGWTLLGNPFYQQIDWDNISKTDLTNSVYVYDVNAAGWKSWNGFLGSLTDGIIDIYDAFFVQSTSDDAYLQIPYPSGGSGGEADKVLAINNEVYFFSLELKNDSSLSNKAWFQFSESGEFGIDASDAFQLNPLSSQFVTLASMLNDSTYLDINSLPLITEAFEIPLELNTTEPGTHTLSLKDINFPEEWELELFDSENETSSKLEEAYSFTIEASKAKNVKVQDVDSPPSIGTITKMRKSKAANQRFSIKITPSQTVPNEVGPNIPQQVELQQNYPNPFNPSSIIQFGVPNTSKVRLEVYDLLGRKVATLINGESRIAGRYNVQFNASNLASGLYIYRLQVGNNVLTKKMTLIK